MSKTRDLKRRIRSISSTRQLTKAMKMVSAAKMRRATDRIVAARPFSHNMNQVLKSLAARADLESHPLLKVKDTEKMEVLLVTGDKGLCGSFNTNINKTTSYICNVFAVIFSCVFPSIIWAWQVGHAFSPDSLTVPLSDRLKLRPRPLFFLWLILFPRPCHYFLIQLFWSAGSPPLNV